MLNDDLENEYFEWLYRNICYGKYRRKPHRRKLLFYMHETEFTYLMAKDGNRAQDGKDLRYRFGDEQGYSSAAITCCLEDRPCSVLEMMVALAKRCEDTIMTDTPLGNRTGDWFWGMVFNMGLQKIDDEQYDRDYVVFVIQRFLAREYDSDGKGGLFTVEACDRDMRSVEIWYQMHMYLNTIS